MCLVLSVCVSIPPSFGPAGLWGLQDTAEGAAAFVLVLL